MSESERSALLPTPVSETVSVLPVLPEAAFGDYPRHAKGLPPLVLERGDYRLHFASTREELDALLRLRFDVYNLEMGEGLAESEQTERDADAFDAQCHHLFVQHKDSGECVGTYRLQTAAMAKAGCGFYTDQEFRVAEFLITLVPSGSVLIWPVPLNVPT